LKFIKKDFAEVAKNTLVGFQDSSFSIVGVFEIPTNVQQLAEIPVPASANYFFVVQGTYAGGVTGNDVKGEAQFQLEF
jgi:hypothetical protein